MICQTCGQYGHSDKHCAGVVDQQTHAEKDAIDSWIDAHRPEIERRFQQIKGGDYGSLLTCLSAAFVAGMLSERWRTSVKPMRIEPGGDE